MKKMFFMIAIMVMIGSGFFGRSLMEAMAEDDDFSNYQKYYTSIEIKEGDSLWTIAKKYSSNSGKTTEDYIKELKQMNQLGEDTIHTGSYLTVSYYSDESQ